MMEQTILRVDGMSCQHCVNAITDAVSVLDGVDQVEIDLDAKTVTVVHNLEAVSIEKIRDEIEDQGFDIVG
jgi:copper chaperone